MFDSIAFVLADVSLSDLLLDLVFHLVLFLLNQAHFPLHLVEGCLFGG